MQSRMMKLGLATCLMVPLLVAGGCGRGAAPDPEKLSNTEVSLEEAESLVRTSRSAAGRAIQRFAPEFLRAATWYEEQAGQLRAVGADAEARAALVDAATLLRNAEAVADTVERRRTLSFPANRSLGNISVKSWELNALWRDAGPAKGSVTIEPAHMVQLGLSPEFSRDDLEYIAQLGPGAVQYLSLSDRKIADEELDLLSKMIGLRDLSLHGAPISDDGMAHLAALKTLRHLNLMATDITDAGVEALGAMPALEEIALGETQVSEQVILTLNTFPELRSVLFRRNELSDVAVDWLAKGPELERLWLHGKGITDFGVPLLTNMKGLKELVLLGTSISEMGARTLRQALPECNVDVVS